MADPTQQPYDLDKVMADIAYENQLVMKKVLDNATILYQKYGMLLQENQSLKIQNAQLTKKLESLQEVEKKMPEIPVSDSSQPIQS